MQGLLMTLFNSHVYSDSTPLFFEWNMSMYLFIAWLYCLDSS